MATRSRICIKLNAADLGRELVQSPDGITTPLAHPCTFPADKGAYVSVYHHFDGYPDGLGEWLLGNITTYEAALNLILGGDISCAIGAVRYYATRGEEWESVKPLQTETPADNDLFIEYVYTFENGEWFVTPSAPTDEVDKYGITIYGTGDRIALREVLERELTDRDGHWVASNSTHPNANKC